MRRHLQALGTGVFGVIGLGLTFVLVTIDAQVLFNNTYLDYPDPDGLGLKGVVVTLSEFWLKTALAIVCLCAAVWLYINLRKSDPPKEQ
jgi:hypothetical protein